MTRKVLLISEDQIKATSIIEKNVDGKLLSRVALNIQEISLKGILGSDLYTSILDAVYLKQVSGTPMSDTYVTLVNDYIQPYLVHATLADFIVINNYKISNKGVMKLRDNSSDNASGDDIEYVKNYIDNHVGQYKMLLIDYLSDNSLVNGCSTDTDTTSQSTGWYLQ